MSVREGKRRQRAREERRKTNPGLAEAEMTDDVVKDIIKGRTGEQERIQQIVFAKWINSRFVKAGSTRRVEDLFQDFRTGVNLAALVELITGVKVPVEKGRTRLHYVCNITKALEVLEQNEIKLVNVHADDIEYGNTKLTLSLTWAIIQQYYVRRLGGAVEDLRVNNLEKTLLCWCQLATKGYPHVDVRNLSTSWTDGLAFNALIHKYREDLFDYSALLNNAADVNLAHAFHVAETQLGVSPLLEPEDLLQGTPDQKSVITYLLCLLEALPHETMEVRAVTAISELDTSAASTNGNPVHNAEAYTASVESVLAWMLAVEEKLDRCEISDDLPQARKLWSEHEALLSELVVQQHSLQVVLDHSARLLQNPKLPAKQVADVERNITVLTEKWENLQIKTTERTKLLEKIITILQGERLNSVNVWLVDTESRVTALKANANSIESMDAQLRELSKLQDDLEKQLNVMNDLLTVVITGEEVGNGDTERTLGDFRQRWEDICRWTESQWTLVGRIRRYYDDFLKLCVECSEWINSRIELLQSLPSAASDRLDWVQRNVDLLHEMHDQMLDYQERIQMLQEKSDELVAYFTPQSAVGMQVRRKEEKICAEWNQLVDLLEFWTSDKNMHFEKSDILRTSKIRHSKRFSDAVDSSVTSQTVEENERQPKKAKQEEMDEGLMENCQELVDWLREKEHQLSGINCMSEKQRNSPERTVIAQVRDELNGKEPEYKSLKMLADDIINEKRSAGISCDSVEIKLNELATLWNNLNWLVGDKREVALSSEQDRASFTHNLEVLENVLISCQKTLERFNGDKDLPAHLIDQDLDDCRGRVHLMEINETRVRETSALARKIAAEGTENGETEASPWEEFAARWQAVREQMSDKEKSLVQAKEQQPVKKFMLDLANLQGWINQVHQSLMDEPPVRANFLDKMQDTLLHYQQVEKSLQERQDLLERVNNPPRQLTDKLTGTSFQLDLIDLNSKWKDIRQYLQHNTLELTKWIDELTSFQIDVAGLKQWMNDVDSFLNIDIETVDDNKTFASVQEQFQGLEEDIRVLAPTVDKLLEVGRVFLRTDQKDFIQHIQDCIKDLETQWMSICTRAARQLQVVAAVSASRKRSMGIYEREIQELEQLKRRLPVETDIPSLEALEKAMETVQDVKHALAAEREAVQAIEDKVDKKPGDRKTLSEEEAIHQLDMLLYDIATIVEEREKHFAQMSEKWTLFSGLLSEHHAWMDKLEPIVIALENSDENTDRRALLRELHEYLSSQNSDHYGTTAEFAEEFSNRKILAPLVQADLEKLRQRLHGLFKRATEQQSLPIESDSRYSLFSEASSEGVASTALVQSPFMDSLERVSQLLSQLRSKLPATELKLFDSTVIKGQLDDCVQLYAALSGIKGEVQELIKQGREIVEAQTSPVSPENDSLSQRLDTMKTDYNQLGAQVTATKAELDNALKLVKKAEKELDVWRASMDEIDSALAELAKLAGVDDYNDAVESIKENMHQREGTVVGVRNMRQQMREIAMKPNIPGFDPKYTENSQRWTGMQNRVKSTKPGQVVLQKIPPITSTTEITSTESRHGQTVVREELTRTTITTVIDEKPAVVRHPSGHKSSPPPLNLELTHLKEYQRSLQQQIDSLHDNMVLSNVEGKKPAGREAKEFETEVTSLKERLESARSVEKDVNKFNALCGRIEEKTRSLLKTAPVSLTEVNARFSELEALKHEVALNEAVYKDVLHSVDVALGVRGGPEVASGDSGQLELVKNSIIQRWTGIQQSLHSTEQNLVSVRSLHQLLENDLLPWLEHIEVRGDNLSNTLTENSSTSCRMLLEERDGKIPVYNRVLENGHGLLSDVYKSSNGEPLRTHLEKVGQRWDKLAGRFEIGREFHGTDDILDVEKYMAILHEHIDAVMRKKTELATMQPSGDRALLQKLHNYQQLFRAQLEAKKPEIEAVLSRGRVIEERLQSQQPSSKQTHTTVSMDELGRNLKLLSDSWQSLFRDADTLQQDSESLTKELDSLLKLVETSRVKLDDLERECKKWEPTDEIAVADLSRKLEESKKFKSKVDTQSAKLDELNSLAARIQRTPGGLSEEVVRSVERLNIQKGNLSRAVDDRQMQLEGALEDVSTSDNQHFLATSVDEPWERRVSPSKAPYYINHEEQRTQWDHPRFTEFMMTLLEANQIRFSAYRTAAKLRHVQRRLYLDFLSLKVAAEIFDKCDLRARNNTTLDCADAVNCLMIIYERLNVEHQNRINFALGIDLCLNWLLNCHDPERSGQIPVLAFKLSIVVLCHGDLIDKYKYLFRLIADENQHADQGHIAQLLHHSLQIPRFLGEVAAFGGSNVDPSVKSCFELSSNGIDIQARQFLAWLTREPQALVWLSVLHRLIAAEASRHPAKCNICRQFPIQGLRYRCLKCFNFDLCQTCFFAGHKSKHHKISHPMQEYCFPASSSEDMKDFRRVLKNKLRAKESYSGNSKHLGYLPVQQVNGSARSHSSDPTRIESSTLSSLNTKGSVSSSGDADFTQSRVIEFEGSRDMSTPEVDDEHGLIARYSSLLNGTETAQTAGQVLQAVEREEKQEMEEYLRQLQLDHDRLISELEGVRQLHEDLPNDDMVAEATLLREDKGRLEARMKILEDHNRQLDAQLQRIKHLLEENNERNSASPVPTNGSVTSGGRHYDSASSDMVVPTRISSRSPSSVNSSPALSKPSVRQDKYSVGQLFHAAGSLNQAVGTLVTVMNEEERRLESSSDKAVNGK